MTGLGRRALRPVATDGALRMDVGDLARRVAVVSHGFSKASKIPPAEIRRATSRMEKFRADPVGHTFAEGG